MAGCTMLLVQPAIVYPTPRASGQQGQRHHLTQVVQSSATQSGTYTKGYEILD